MTTFDVAAVLLGLAALFAYLNFRTWRADTWISIDLVVSSGIGRHEQGTLA
jgi:hypothetical protein